MQANGRGAINPQVINQAKQVYQRAQSQADANNVVKLRTYDANGIAGQYPIQLGSADDYDIRAALKQSSINEKGVVSTPGGGAMGIAIAGDKDFDYLQRKKEEVFYSQFLASINAQADLSNPASAAWWFERFPFLKEKRLEEINREAEKQKRLAQIQVTGPQNEDDFFLLYMIDQGLVAKPHLPLTKMYQDPRYATNTTNFTKGLFSPLSYLPGENGGLEPKGREQRGMPNTIRSLPRWNDPLQNNGGRGVVAGSMPKIPTRIEQLWGAYPNAEPIL